MTAKTCELLRANPMNFISWCPLNEEFTQTRRPCETSPLTQRVNRVYDWTKYIVTSGFTADTGYFTFHLPV